MNKKKKPKNRAKARRRDLVKLFMELNEEQKEEVKDLSSFIDAHGGKLGAFRAYQVRPPSTPPPAERA